MEYNKKVMIFGGSYNPIHQGHLNAALTASIQLKVDEVWLMPRKYNYDGSLLLDGKHRVKMMEMAIAELNNFKICKLELQDRQKKLIYTYHSAKKLTSLYKNIDFYFLIGADQLNNLKHWYKANELSKLFKLVCYKRPGYVINEQLVKEYNVMVIDGPQVDISSTKIRSGYFNKIDEDIKQYIMDKQLYLKERVMPLLPEERFLHVLSTARIAKRIALSNHVDTNRAYVAGILHDIAKGLTNDEIFGIVKEHFSKYISAPKYALHAYASAYIAYHDFKITDKKILKAIFYHCKPCKHMSKLDKIIYCADKLEEQRPFAAALSDLRRLAFENIDQCFILLLKQQIQIVTQRKEEIDESIYEIIRYYERKENGR